MDVGEYSESGAAKAGENLDAFFQAETAVGRSTTAIGFIEGSFEYELSGCLSDLAREEVDVFLAFDHARPRNQCERLPAADFRQRTQSACENCSVRVLAGDLVRFKRF